VGDDRRHLGVGDAPLLDGAREGVETPQTIQLVRMADLRRIEGPPQHRKRLVVNLERHREWMAVLAAMREREPRRIGESGGRTVHHFRDERERLQRPRPQLLDQQKRREVAELPLVRECQDSAEPPRIDVSGANVVMRRQDEPAGLGQGVLWIGARQSEQRVLGRSRPAID